MLLYSLILIKMSDCFCLKGLMFSKLVKIPVEHMGKFWAKSRLENVRNLMVRKEVIAIRGIQWI